MEHKGTKEHGGPRREARVLLGQKMPDGDSQEGPKDLEEIFFGCFSELSALPVNLWPFLKQEILVCDPS
jgi:hypothetical protein